VVTGGGRGIGAAVASELARLGASVTIMGRDAATLQRQAAELSARHGGDVHATSCDVADDASVERAFADARAALGDPYVLVNNAGQGISAPLVQTTREAWDRLLAVNLTGSFLCMQQVLPRMLAARDGRIVNVASTAGVRGYARLAAYSATKHGVVGLTRSAAAEVAKQGVTVNAVCPGYVDTPMLETGVARIVEKTGLTAEEARRRLADMSPQKRLYTAEEVSALVLFLCGEAAAGINGQALSVDGGTVV